MSVFSAGEEQDLISFLGMFETVGTKVARRKKDVKGCKRSRA